MEKAPLDEAHIDELLSKMLEGRYIELHLEVGKPPYVRTRSRGAYKLVELKSDESRPFAGLNSVVVAQQVSFNTMRERIVPSS